MSDEPVAPDIVAGTVPPENEESGAGAEQKKGTNDYFRSMMDRNFLDYASYVIGSRAIPDVDDGLKPVQRRILWTLFRAYDNGRTTKTANIVGNTMHFHPHGDASIGDALVVLANKGGIVEEEKRDAKTGAVKKVFTSVPYYIKKQGNFGNILTGSPAAAARYTECSLTTLACETLFNNDITKFIPNYDGREVEPVVLPAKIPSLLLLGSDGIAVGMSTMVLPHNFNELIDAEIAHLKGESFQLFPDFQQGGVMDVREYDDGNGRIVLRAKIDIDGRELVIREIPASCTATSLIESIERAAKKNKIKISNVDDFTSDHVEIRVTPTRGYDPAKTLQGLYMYTDCSVSLSPKLMVICDRRPVQMSVSDVLKRNTEKLVAYLKREFEIALERQNELRHAKTLAQLFFENRIYKRIEECRDAEAEYREVEAGLAPFRAQLLRDVTREDIDKLLALPVRRIARFDIEKNQQELRDIAAKIKEIKHHLAHLVDYTISYLENIKKEYGADFPRHTEIERFEQIDRSKAALNNIKIGWDRKNGYVGTAVKSDDVVVCNEFDRFLCVEKKGAYKVIPLPPEKLFIDKLYDFRRYDAKTVYGVVYRDKKSGKCYCKRTRFGGYILEKEYRLIPPGAVLELFTPRADAIYTLEEIDGRSHMEAREINLMEFPLRSSKARGILLTAKKLNKLTHLRYLTEEEMALYAEPETLPEDDSDSESAEPTEAERNAVPAENVIPPEKETGKDEESDSAPDTPDVSEKEADLPLPEEKKDLTSDAVVSPERRSGESAERKKVPRKEFRDPEEPQAEEPQAEEPQAEEP
ncbi:MAG: DNA topoisomerase IV subunit A, partial [Victivallaceae bacterium]|nr:DNA topoisomerase IV subunit A [Victivallaceae bacterium]